MLNNKAMLKYCPLCNSPIDLQTVKRTLKIKGLDITADYKVYQCDNCKQEFTTDEIDQINIDNFKECYKKSYAPNT